MAYLYNQTPRWVDYSGLPEKLNLDISSYGWAVFKRLMELDFLSNLEPDLFQEPIEGISRTLGLKPDEIRDTLNSLKEKGYIECYIPETDQEPAYFRIIIPLATPVSPRDLSIENGGMIGSGEPIRLRYYSVPEENPIDNKFKLILHLYFELCGLKLNSLIIEDLKEMERSFTMDEIKSAFQKAKRNKMRSLRPVFKILYGKEIKDEKNKKRSVKKMDS